MKREALVTIHGRKEEGYPGHSFHFIFKSVEELITKIDKKIEDLDYRKVDVYVEDDSQFTDEEIANLEKENIMFS
jgi:hypothetical protein